MLFHTLDKSINVVSQNGNGMKFLIEGHANDYKNEKNNLKLSKKRAKTIYNYIKNKAPEIANQFEIKGVGSSDLLYPECKDFEICRKKGEEWKNEANGRVIFKVLDSNSNTYH